MVSGFLTKLSRFRPVAVAQRLAAVLTTAAWVGAGLLYDRATGGLDRNAPARAAQVIARLFLCNSMAVHGR